MFLSRVPMDIHNRNTLKVLQQPQKIHGAVEHSFPEPRKRRLWRIDSLQDQLWLLIVSEDIPNLQSIHQQFGNQDISFEIRNYDVLLDRIEKGQQWRFRLTANPTKASPLKDNEKRGKCYAHITPEAQKQWLLRKAEHCGFSLQENDFVITESKRRVFYKQNLIKITVCSATFEGILKVTDAETFRSTLTNGIGREKAYGMGMLTVMHL